MACVCAFALQSSRSSATARGVCSERYRLRSKQDACGITGKLLVVESTSAKWNCAELSRKLRHSGGEVAHVDAPRRCTRDLASTPPCFPLDHGPVMKDIHLRGTARGVCSVRSRANSAGSRAYRLGGFTSIITGAASIPLCSSQAHI